MDRRLLSRGQMIAAVAGVALLVATFLPWIGFGDGGGTITVPGVGDATIPNAPGVDVDTTSNLWDGPTLDIYLLITAIVAIVPALLALTGSAEEFSFVSAATLLLGFVGAILVIAFLTVDFPDGADRKYGAFIGLVAVIGIAFGGFRAMQEEVAAEI